MMKSFKLKMALALACLLTSAIAPNAQGYRAAPSVAREAYDVYKGTKKGYEVYEELKREFTETESQRKAREMENMRRTEKCLEDHGVVGASVRVLSGFGC